MLTTASSPVTPFARGLPWLGSSISLARDPLAYLVAQYRKLGPIFRVRVPGREYTVLAGLEANQLLHHSTDEIVDHTQEYRVFQEALETPHVLPPAAGHYHRELRNLQKRAYSPRSLADKIPELVDTVHRFTDKWAPGAVFLAETAIRPIVIEQTAIALVGSTAIEICDDLRVAMNALIRVGIVEIWPRWVLRLPNIRKSVEHCRAHVRSLLASRRVSAMPERKDLIADLMDARWASGEQLENQVKEAAVLGAFAAAMDTVTNTTTMLLHMLHSHGDVLKRVRAEIDEILESGELSLENFKRMPVLRGAVMETMRLHPIAPVIRRRAAEVLTFDGHLVTPGTRIMFATCVPHYMDEYFPEAEHFDVGRYSAPRSERRKHPHAYSPYGLGPHTCLGQSIADLQVPLIAAAILCRFELAHEPANYRLRKTALPFPRPLDLNFRVLRRRS